MYKAFCDSCGNEIAENHSGVHRRYLGKLIRFGADPEIELTILAREKVKNGEASKHFHTCWLCMKELLELATKGVGLNGEETESKVARVSPEWEGP